MFFIINSVQDMFVASFLLTILKFTLYSTYSVNSISYSAEIYTFMVQNLNAIDNRKVLFWKSVIIIDMFLVTIVVCIVTG